jgi:nickel transport protein
MPGCTFYRLRNQPIRSRPRIAAIVAASIVLSPLAAPPADALDLLATHEVTAQFATADGKPMAGAEVRVFAPGGPKTPVATGRTDAAGKFVFAADRDGMWSAEARTSNQIARIMIRIGGGSSPDRGANPFLVIGTLAVLLVVAFWYRLRRMRPPPPKR